MIKSNRKNIKFVFYNDMKEALQHRPTEDLFKKHKKHKIIPTTVQQPPVKRVRAIPLSTTVEENEYLLTDDPMLEQEQQQDEGEILQQQQQEKRENYEKQLY
jgi:hypothetical protein